MFYAISHRILKQGGLKMFYRLVYCLSALAFFSTASFAEERSSSIPFITVHQTEVKTLLLHNFSNEEVSISIYGEILLLPPASGSQFNCQGYSDIAVEFLRIEHDFFEIPCNSRMVIEASFTQQYSE